MDPKTALALLSLALSLSNTAVYVLSVFRGKTKPHAFSWGIWGLIAAVVFFAQRAEGAGVGAWTQGLNAVTCTCVMVLGLTHGDRGYARSDWLALLAALVSIPLWIATGTPLWSVALLCVIDAAGFYPTFRKSWRKPREEPAVPYLLWSAGALVSIASIESYTLAATLYPAFLASINFAFVAMLALRRKSSLES